MNAIHQLAHCYISLKVISVVSNRQTPVLNLVINQQYVMLKAQQIMIIVINFSTLSLSTLNREANMLSAYYFIPLTRSPIKLWTGRSSPSPPGATSNSLQSADLAQPGIPGKMQIKGICQVLVV